MLTPALCHPCSLLLCAIHAHSCSVPSMLTPALCHPCSLLLCAIHAHPCSISGHSCSVFPMFTLCFMSSLLYVIPGYPALSFVVTPAPCHLRLPLLYVIHAHPCSITGHSCSVSPMFTLCFMSSLLYVIPGYPALSFVVTPAPCHPRLSLLYVIRGTPAPWHPRLSLLYAIHGNPYSRSSAYCLLKLWMHTAVNKTKLTVTKICPVGVTFTQGVTAPLFKSSAKPLSLAGTRSLSEDSVFSTEARDSTNKFPIAAVSVENITTKSAFQSELLSKLNKRRSLYSDDERDDGLPKSPVPPPLNTADVIALKTYLSSGDISVSGVFDNEYCIPYSPILGQ
ncbi:hypothetical protein Btru_031998 [Bulinus truncatus]|nr:hypothetical protein Btru_031998 [Bulinus truncatus]